jgi:hypothetical protein
MADGSVRAGDAALREGGTSRDAGMLADASGVSDASNDLDAMLHECRPNEYELPDGSCEMVLIL